MLLVALSLAGCTLKGPNIPVLTGDVQELTWTELTWTELTWMVTDEEEDDGKAVEKTGATVEVEKLIDERKTQPADESKLNEEDIGLMEEIIQKVSELGK